MLTEKDEPSRLGERGASYVEKKEKGEPSLMPLSSSKEGVLSASREGVAD